MRIPKTCVRTAWKADWLTEFGLGLVALAFLTKEIIFAVIGAGILLILASLGLLFHQRLDILRRKLDVVERLHKASVHLGDSIEGDLTIRNGSRLTARILTVHAIVEKGLSFKLSSSVSAVLRPGKTLGSKFVITSLARGRFQISEFILTLSDGRGLFTGEAKFAQADWVEVYPRFRVQAPLTPLRLYGGASDILRKAPAGTDYAGTREYTPGDEHHRVDWKATARLRRLMVKQFHPETETTLQILIDAGRTMHRPSYVGTRLDEALAVAELLVESATRSGNHVGIWIYDDAEIVQTMKPAVAEEQLHNIRRLALVLRPQTASEQASIRVPPPAEPSLLGTSSFLVSHVAEFVRLLKFRSSSSCRKTGVWKAITGSNSMGLGGAFVILTDLQTDDDALLKAVSSLAEPGLTIVAQVGAPWRLSEGLEEAYAKYQENDRMLRRLQHSGLASFDLRPEMLIEAMAQEIGKHGYAYPRIRMP